MSGSMLGKERDSERDGAFIVLHHTPLNITSTMLYHVGRERFPEPHRLVTLPTVFLIVTPAFDAAAPLKAEGGSIERKGEV